MRGIGDTTLTRRVEAILSDLARDGTLADRYGLGASVRCWDEYGCRATD
ncbi:hypothetical protein RNZ50_24400 [Paracoccaceae bacterium Fryx2]|nr:hypothetical protein [Paracoccaceae bacterium Fryx2]